MRRLGLGCLLLPLFVGCAHARSPEIEAAIAHEQLLQACLKKAIAEAKAEEEHPPQPETLRLLDLSTERDRRIKQGLEEVARLSLSEVKRTSEAAARAIPQYAYLYYAGYLMAIKSWWTKNGVSRPLTTDERFWLSTFDVAQCADYPSVMRPVPPMPWPD